MYPIRFQKIGLQLSAQPGPERAAPIQGRSAMNLFSLVAVLFSDAKKLVKRHCRVEFT